MDLSPRQFSPAMMPKQKPTHEQPTGYSLSGHAAQQSRAKGWNPSDVLQAANDPHTTYDNGRYPDQKRHIRGDIVAVVHPESQKVVTVYRNVTETDLRPDQSDEDARRYGARRRG
jgi:hypothetical protein